MEEKNSLLGQATMEEAYNRIVQLEEENETLKANVEFLHSCLDDRGKSIELMKEENKKLKEEKKTEGIKKYYRQVIKVQNIRTINDFNEEEYNEYRVVAIIDKTCIPGQKSDGYYVILEKEII